MTISLDAPWGAFFQGLGLLSVVVAAIWLASRAGSADSRPAGEDAPYEGDGSSP